MPSHSSLPSQQCSLSFRLLPPSLKPERVQQRQAGKKGIKIPDTVSAAECVLVMALHGRRPLSQSRGRSSVAAALHGAPWSLQELLLVKAVLSWARRAGRAGNSAQDRLPQAML